MSVPLPVKQLTGNPDIFDFSVINRQGINASKGTSVYFSDPSKLGILRINNESQYGLQIVFNNSGKGFHLSAGGWVDVYLDPNDTAFNFTYDYSLTNGGVNLLACTYYAPGEPLDAMPTLGNSPINVGGSVSTTSVQELKNDGNAPATTIIESTPSDQLSSSENWNNDASGLEQILSAGSLRTVRSNTRGDSGTGHAVVLFGDSADRNMSTYRGTLDQISSDTGHFKTDGSGNPTWDGFLTFGNTSVGHPTTADAAHGYLYISSGTPNTILTSTLSGATPCGIVFGTWNGASRQLPFSIGGQFSSAPSFIDNSGNITGVGLVLSGILSGLSQLSFPNSIVAQVNGTTSGNFQWAMPLQGPALKLLFIIWNAYKNASGVTQFFTFPTDFNNAWVIFHMTGPFGGTTAQVFNSGGTVATTSELTWGTGTSGGSVALTSGNVPAGTIIIGSGSFHSFDAPFNNTTPGTGVTLILGT